MPIDLETFMSTTRELGPIQKFSRTTMVDMPYLLRLLGVHPKNMDKVSTKLISWIMAGFQILSRVSKCGLNRLQSVHQTTSVKPVLI